MAGCVKQTRRDRDATTSPALCPLYAHENITVQNQQQDHTCSRKWLSSFRRIFSISSATSLRINKNSAPSFRAAQRASNSQALPFEACIGKRKLPTHLRPMTDPHAARRTVSLPKTKATTKRLHLRTRYSSHSDGRSCGGL